MMLNLTQPNYVMPMHGDYKRMLPARRARRGRRRADRRTSSETENGLPLEIDAKGARFGEPEQAGMVFVDGVDIGDVADVALRDRRMLSADGIFIVVATISEQDGSSVVPPEVLAAASRSSTTPTAFIDELREAVEDSLDRAAEQQITEIEVLQTVPARRPRAFIYKRLKRRPMVLPVVVEV